MEPNSLFREVTRRFFFIIGATDDEFALPDLTVLSLEEALHAHLLELGYQRVVFYDGVKKVYFWDHDSLRRSLPPRPGSPAPGDRLAGSPGGAPPLSGRLVSGPLGGRRVSLGSTTPPAPPVAQERLHLGGMDDVEAATHLDRCMRDPTCRTAVVFSNGLDFLAHTDSVALRPITARMTRWQQLTGQNNNICIFLFPPLAATDVESLLGQRGGWAFFRSQMFTGTTLSSQVHTVGSPQAEEVIWLLERLRICHGKPADVLGTHALAVRLCRLPRETSRQLKRLYARLLSLPSLRPDDLTALLGDVDEESALDRLRAMEGLDAVRTRLDQILTECRERDAFAQDSRGIAAAPTFPRRLLPRRPRETPVTLHMILRGRPGTGKTTVAELLGDIYRDHGLLPIGHTVKVTRKDLVAAHIGGTALRTAERIEEAIGGVLFVDEAYQLAEGGEHDFGKEAIETLMEAMSAQNGQFALVLAGYPEQMNGFIEVNPGIARRIGPANVLTIADYKPPVLHRIFLDRARRAGRSLDSELGEALPIFFDNWYRARDPAKFGNAGDVMELFAEMNQLRASRVTDPFAADARVLTLADLPERLRRHIIPTPHTADEVLRALDDLVGLAPVKAQIRKMFNRIQLDRRRGRGLPAPGHYRFEGPPGTGKTTAARRMGDMFRALGVLERGHVVSVGRADLVGAWQGRSAEKTTTKINEALDGVLFVDEAYQLTLDPLDTFGREAAGTLLQLMEEHRDRLTVIIAGYRAELEKFIASNDGFASRFTRRFEFPAYTPVEMLEILEGMVSAEGFRADDGFLAGSRGAFERLAASPVPEFANGRGVRTFLERAREEQANRLAGDEAASVEDLSLLTVADLPRGI